MAPATAPAPFTGYFCLPRGCDTPVGTALVRYRVGSRSNVKISRRNVDRAARTPDRSGVHCRQSRESHPQDRFGFRSLAGQQASHPDPGQGSLIRNGQMLFSLKGPKTPMHGRLQENRRDGGPGLSNRIKSRVSSGPSDLKGPKTRSGAISVDVCSRDGGFWVKGMACPARAVEPACCPRAEFLVSEAPWRF